MSLPTALTPFFFFLGGAIDGGLELVGFLVSLGLGLVPRRASPARFLSDENLSPELIRSLTRSPILGDHSEVSRYQGQDLGAGTGQGAPGEAPGPAGPGALKRQHPDPAGRVHPKGSTQPGRAGCSQRKKRF